MPSLNRVEIIGHLGGDPEQKFLNNGDAVCNFTIATSEKWKDKSSGETKEATEWHRVVCFRRTAEIAGQYLRKGSLARVVGSLKTRKWQDKNGQDRYTTEIQVQDLMLLPNGKPAEKKKAEPEPQGGFDDDIPFD